MSGAYWSKSLAESKMDLYMTALSNIYTAPSTSASSANTPRETDRCMARAGAEYFQRGRAGGWAILIQCLLCSESEGANGVFLTRLTLDQSHHTFSQGTFFSFLFFQPPFPPPTLHYIHSLFHFYSVKGKRKKKKKNKVDKGCPPGSQKRREKRGGGAQIALQKTGLRAEISHNAADKKVGHITFGRHVTGMQTW